MRREDNEFSITSGVFIRGYSYLAKECANVYDATIGLNFPRNLATEIPKYTPDYFKIYFYNGYYRLRRKVSCITFQPITFINPISVPSEKIHRFYSDNDLESFFFVFPVK